MGLPLFINAAVLSFSWTCRYRDDTVGALQDGKWILLVTAWIARHWILHLLFYCFLTIYDHKWRSITALSTTTFALLFSFSFKSAKLVWERKVYSRQCQQYHPLHPEEDAIPRLFRPRPLVFPSMIHHARIFPQKHSFSYPYLMVGIPVGWRGSVGTFLSADLKSLPWHGKPPPAAWLSVESADHLARGDHVHGLQGKLDAYLESICENPDEFKHAYVITAPTVFGYSFSPASFWYLYDDRNFLVAMIVEVNNTFDERRMYFSRNETQSAAVAHHFSSRWDKDFHVSPFNSRKGSYVMSARDPWLSPKTDCQFKNTIQLLSSKKSLKLVASVASVGVNVDPATFDRRETIIFLLSWWRIGLMTFPRILIQAAKLYFGRKLHVWYRPEVNRQSVARKATRDETAIEDLFASYLRSLVENSDLPFHLLYGNTLNSTPVDHTFTPHSLTEEPKVPEDWLLFKPTNPVFYADLARAAHLPDVVVSNPDPLKSLFYTSSPKRLLELFKSAPASISTAAPPNLSSSNAPTPLPGLTHLSWARWQMIKVSRTLKLWKGRPFTHTFQRAKDGAADKHYLSTAPFSELDLYAIRSLDTAKAEAYRRATLKILASDVFAFGFPEIVDAALWIFRIWLYALHVQALRVMFSEAFLGGGTATHGYGTWWSLAALGGLHLWGWLGSRI